jgi:hypothetical protein
MSKSLLLKLIIIMTQNMKTVISRLKTSTCKELNTLLSAKGKDIIILNLNLTINNSWIIKINRIQITQLVIKATYCLPQQLFHGKERKRSCKAVHQKRRLFRTIALKSIIIKSRSNKSVLTKNLRSMQ